MAEENQEETVTEEINETVAETETKGNRTSELHNPRRSAAYLTGPGLASQNKPS